MSTDQGKIFSSGDIIEDKWVILEFIDKGAFGEVYRAHQLNLQRDVAIKVVSQDWLKSTLENDEEIEIALQRFRREVHAMARVRHPNVLQVFDNGTIEIANNGNGYPVEFIALEYIPGDTLRYTMSQEGLYPEQDLVKEWLEDYFFPVLHGVKAIHDLDMVHRDLKPENILMDGKVPKIADFGLADAGGMGGGGMGMGGGGRGMMGGGHMMDYGRDYAIPYPDQYKRYIQPEQPYAYGPTETKRLRQEIRTKRQELSALYRSENPDKALIDKKIDELGKLENELDDRLSERDYQRR